MTRWRRGKPQVRRGGVAVALQAGITLALLAGLYVLGLAFVIVTAGLAVWNLVRQSSGGTVAYVLPVDVIIVATLFGLSGRHHADAAGAAIPEEEFPELWNLVRSLADDMNTRPPQEIRLTAEPNAAVVEDTRFLGLIGGTRRLLVGVPLLQVLPPAELAAVVCHELGHYSRGHTRLGVVSYRVRKVLEELMAG